MVMMMAMFCVGGGCCRCGGDVVEEKKKTNSKKFTSKYPRFRAVGCYENPGGFSPSYAYAYAEDG